MRYRRRSVEVDAEPIAVLLIRGSKHPKWVAAALAEGSVMVGADWVVVTFEGTTRGYRGDWLVKDDVGKVSVVRRAEFEKEYEPVGAG